MKKNAAVILMFAHFPLMFAIGFMDIFKKGFDLWTGIIMISLHSLILWFNLAINKQPFFDKLKYTLWGVIGIFIGIAVLVKYFG